MPKDQPEPKIDNPMTIDAWWRKRKRDRDEGQPGSEEDERYEED